MLLSVRSEGMIRSFAEKPGKVFLLYGERSIFQLSLQMAAHAMAGGNSIAVVDGCNRFDVHALSRFARMRKIDPNKFLSRIFISRGFTCYQMEQAIAHKLPSFLSTIHSNTALIFGLLDTFYDEQASPAGSAADSSETSCFISENESIGLFAFTGVLRKNCRSARTQSIIYHAEERRRPRV